MFPYDEDEENTVPMAPNAPAVSVEMNPLVKDTLMKKYNLGPYSDQARQDLESSSTPNGYDAIASALGAVSAGFGGRDPVAAARGIIGDASTRGQNQLNQFDKGRANKIQEIGMDRQMVEQEREDKKYSKSEADAKMEEDPISPQSKIAQDAAKAMGVAGDVSKLTAKAFKEMGPTYQKIYEINEKKSQRAEDRGFKEKELAIKEMAAKGENKKLNSTEKQFGNYVTDGIRGLSQMKKGIAAGDNTFSLIGDNDYTAGLNRMAENYGRMQSGGAINKEEEKRFKALAPGITDSAEIAKQKMQNLEDMYQERAKVYNVSQDQIDFASKGSSPLKPKTVVQNGHTYTLNEKTGEYE